MNSLFPGVVALVGWKIMATTFPQNQRATCSARGRWKATNWGAKYQEMILQLGYQTRFLY